MTYGATPEQWTHLDLILGLTEDLLPVVSNPNVKKSEHSSIKEPGKLPSRFNARREMVGFPKWTDHRTTSKEITAWAKEPDYGICIQTRNVRAIDVDIDDFLEALEVEKAIIDHLGFKPPCRRRGKAEKFLMTVIVEGDLTKRRFKTAKGVIEFLAQGQQFIAIGTHPNGTRYVWDDGLPNSIPVLDIAEFESLWSKLAEDFAVEDSVTVRKGMTPEKKRQAEDIDDPLVPFLVDHWTVHDISGDGRVDIVCPFEDGHSSDSGTTSTSYYPAGVGGFQRGHFKCLHASCAHRTDQDFKDKIGYTAHGFDELPPLPAPTPVVCEKTGDTLPAKDRSAYRRDVANVLDQYRDKKTGLVQVTKKTLFVGLSHKELCGADLAFDDFQETLMVAFKEDEWQAFTDGHVYELSMLLETESDHNFASVPLELMRAAVKMVCMKRRFDTAQLWLNKLKWDGVPRVETFLADYFKAEDTPYTRAISNYIWTALAGRTITPGVKADMVPMAVGDQGLRKTSAVAAMAPDPQFHGELDLSKRDDDQARDLRGKMIMEIGEMKGASARGIEHLKAFISRTEEKWVKKYQEYQSSYKRRCLFFATTNEQHALPHDDTGNRRWLPFMAGVTGDKCDASGIAEVREQLWAEGAVLYRKHGVLWEDAEFLARAHLSQFEMEDPWTPRIKEWLFTNDGMDGPIPAEGPFHYLDVARGALNIMDRDMARHVMRRITGILRTLGFESRKVGNDKKWVLVKSR